MKWHRFQGIAAGIGILICTLMQISMAGQQPPSSAPPAPSAQANNGLHQLRLMAQSDSSDTPYKFAFSPNGRLLASGCMGSTTLWDVATGAELEVLQGVGYNLAFTPDGTQLVGLGLEQTSKGAGGLAVIWDISAGKQVARIHSSVCWQVGEVFSPDARLVATATSKHTIAICDLRADGRTWELEALHADVKGGYSRGVFSRQGDRFAAIHHSATNTPNVWQVALDVWNVQTGKHLRSIPDLVEISGNLFFSSDGNCMAVKDREGITLWNIAEGTSSRLLTPGNTQVRTLAFTANSKTIVGACADHTLRLWNVETGKQISSIPAPTSVYTRVTRLAFTPNDNTLVGIFSDKTLRSWDVATGKQIASFPRSVYEFSLGAFSPDGRYLALRGNDGIKMWDVTTGKAYRQFQGTAVSIRAVAFSTDGRTLALGDGAGTVHLWDTNRGQPVRTLTGHKAQIMSLALSPDGHLLVDSSWDDTVHVWNLMTGVLAHVFPRESPPHSGEWGTEDHDPAWKVAFSPDSRRVAAAGGSSVRVWDVGTWKRRFTLKGHDEHATNVLFTQDGKRIITEDGHATHTTSEHAMLVWNAADGKLLQQLPPQDLVAEMAAPADPQAGWIAVVEGNRMDNRLVLRDTHTWKVIRTLALPASTDIDGNVTTIAVSPDGKRIAASYGRMLCLWDVETGHLLDSASLHTDAIASVAFSPDGTHLVTGGLDTTARLWTIQTNHLQALCTIYLFQNDTWAIADTQNRFDAANNGDVSGLHGVIDGTPVPLSQLKNRYYDPGLLAKYLGFDKAPLKPLDRRLPTEGQN